MACLNPARASIQDGGNPVFSPDGDLLLPCGKCINCLKTRSAQWATRVKHELSLHEHSSFINLTYNEDTVPSLDSFKNRREFTLFIKKLRKLIYPQRIKYIAAHEYGKKTKRPHHHIIVFGYSPPNWKLHSYSARGNPQYTSQELSRLWSNGHATVGPATPGSAYYIASYALKSKNHELLTEDGELLTFKDKMTCSRSLGLDYFIKHQQDLVKYDKLPRYYQKILKEKIDLEQNPETWQSNRLTNRLKKLEPIKGHLHYQYKERIEELQPKTYTNHEHLAVLEISDAQISQHSEREISSIDLKEQQQKKEYLRELIRRQ